MRDLGAGIGEAVLQLRPGPPGVQRRDHGAQRAGGVEGHHPFRHVAHDHRDAVALADALRAASFGDGERGRRDEGLVADPLVLVDQEDLVAVRPRQPKKLAQVGGAFFQTCVRTPRMSSSSISKGVPGRVSSAWASASDMAGNFLINTPRPFMPRYFVRSYIRGPRCCRIATCQEMVTPPSITMVWPVM